MALELPGARRRAGGDGRRCRAAASACENPPVEGEPGRTRWAWRHAFLAAPYLRDTFVAFGVLSDTFETAITWDRFAEFHADGHGQRARAIAEACGAAPDGPGSPGSRVASRTSIRTARRPTTRCCAPAQRGGEVEQWDEIKAAVSETVIEAGGTITHHHAVGRDHRPWYDRQRPDPFAEALRGAKAAVDPPASSTRASSSTRRTRTRPPAPPRDTP